MVDGAEYQFIGVDAAAGHTHFARYTPEHAEVILASYNSSEDRYVEDDRWRLDHGDPEQALREYTYQRPWKIEGEIPSHDFHSVTDPEYNPELNEALEGSIQLDDGEYVLPFRAPFNAVADILETEAEDENDVFVDYRPDYLELAPENALEKYQLEPTVRGHNEITGTKILDKIHILDRGSEEVYDSFQVDELAEDHFVEELSRVDGVDESLAELLVDDYSNLRTVSWAATSDVEHLENTYDMDAHRFFKALGDTEIYRNEQSPDAGKLHIPDHRDDMKQEDLEDVDKEDDSIQAGFDDF
ncbi:hypothetical protein [Haloplanus natans]|uniref:hypothetical protein n=1 Tax=Haloplanus natans TaxID=376171 RepID=UPI00067811DE|nr:hypothetical protein [Haloplanus natans]